MAEINQRASVSSPGPPSPPPGIHALADTAYDKVSAFITNQIQGTMDEYSVLEKMNRETAQRYRDMISVGQGVVHKLDKLNTKYETLRPFLHQIDELDEGTKRLDEAASKLEQYVTALEHRFGATEGRREGV